MTNSPLTHAGLNAQEIFLTLTALDGDDMAFYGSSAYEKLFVYYSDDMPYGTQKARDGDPIIWILDRLDEEGVTT